MNEASGFTTGFSFYDSAPFYPGTVTVYDGLNGTGNVLATLNLPLTSDGIANGLPVDYDPFVPFGVSFTGVAQSVNFSGTANYIAFDNITVGSATPVPPAVPEPSLALLGLGGVGLALYARKRRRF